MELSLLAANIRSLIRWGGVCLLGLAFLWLIWLFLSFSIKIIFPVAPPEANTAFGKIPAPFQIASSKKITYKLETPGEEFPENPTFLPVFAISAPKGSFNSLDVGSKLASSAGLDPTPIKLNEPVWRWSSTQNANRSLKLNIVNGNFVYAYDWIADPTSLQGIFKTNDDDLATQARSFLDRFSSLKDDLKTGETSVTYWRLDGNNRNKVSSLSEANAALVEFFRKKITFDKKEYPVVEPNSNFSLINVLISPNSDFEKSLLEINFTYWPIDLNDSGTYTLRTASEAFDELKLGKGFVATGNSNRLSRVSISKISLAYFNPVKDSTRYLEPVYVFEGDGSNGSSTENFVAYISAISSDLLK